ncbi:hypothetical protein E4005_02740 [Enterobacter roggenkampii]|nr:hypothetical protein E4005_02740 [Enterobacter roggenkampii]
MQIRAAGWIDLPEEYLLWFARKDEFPAGRWAS